MRRQLGAKADVVDGKRTETTAVEAAELRQAPKPIRVLEHKNEIFRRRATVWDDAHSQLMYPWCLTWRNEGCRSRGTVACRRCSNQGFYARQTNPIRQRHLYDAHLANTAIHVRADDPAFSYRLMHDELPLTRGRVVGCNRVARLCREHKAVLLIVRCRGRANVAGRGDDDDQVHRELKTRYLDRLEAPDITEHATTEAILNVCAVKYACSNQIVGLIMEPQRTADLAYCALRYNVVYRYPVGTSVQSDRSGQFWSRDFATSLSMADLQGSMGRVADNVVTTAQPTGSRN